MEVKKPWYESGIHEKQIIIPSPQSLNVELVL